MASALRVSLQQYRASSHNEKIVAAEKMAKALENYLEDDDDATASTLDCKIGVTYRRTFSYDGLEYPTVQHAFQAQKLAREEREHICDVNLVEAIKLGREAKLDIAKWDLQKDELMYKLILAQAEQNAVMRITLMRLKDISVVVNDLHDSYWPFALPPIYQKVGAELFDKQANKRARAE